MLMVAITVEVANTVAHLFVEWDDGGFFTWALYEWIRDGGLILHLTIRTLNGVRLTQVSPSSSCSAVCHRKLSAAPSHSRCCGVCFGLLLNVC